MKKLASWVVILLLALAIGNPYTMAWIAGRLVVSDELEPADAVLSLRGSHEEEQLRIGEAARLVQRGNAPLLLVSVESKPYFGQPVRRLIETGLRAKGFPMQKLRFCENNADYTAEEAQALRSCLRQLRARKVTVVTSEYHTRRTRSIFRRVLSNSGIVARVHPVYNPNYWDPHWWRRRRWTKTFVIETLALAWSQFERFRSFRAPDGSRTNQPAAPAR